MACDLVDREKKLEDYFSDKLSEDERQKFEEHFFNCDVCFQQLKAREEVRELIKEKGDVLFAGFLEKQKTRQTRGRAGVLEKLAPGWQSKWLALGAAATVALFLVIFNLRNAPQDDHFAVSPIFDEMVENVMRSGEVSVYSPKNGENLSGDILFKWEAIDLPQLYLKILNNRGEELYKFTVEDGQFEFSERLPSGLYYWKLESEDDLLFVGKFFVNKPDG